MKRPSTEKEIEAKRKKLAAQDLPKFEQEVKKSYKVFKDDSELESTLEVADNIWDIYPTQNFTQGQKDSFEFYFCGWLQYYDEIIRNNAIDHTLRFKWSSNNVTVYICPKPDSSLDPLTCPPAGATSDPKPPTAPPPPYP